MMSEVIRTQTGYVSLVHLLLEVKRPRPHIQRDLNDPYSACSGMTGRQIRSSSSIAVKTGFQSSRVNLTAARYNSLT